jgi:hypothetical protein
MPSHGQSWSVVPSPRISADKGGGGGVTFSRTALYHLVLKIDQNFFSSKCDNLYTIQKPMSNLVDLCCFKIIFYGHLGEKKLKNTKMMNFR